MELSVDRNNFESEEFQDFVYLVRELLDTSDLIFENKSKVIGLEFNDDEMMGLLDEAWQKERNYYDELVDWLYESWDSESIDRREFRATGLVGAPADETIRLLSRNNGTLNLVPKYPLAVTIG